jgi:uncharacterized integral membrane protein
MRVKIVVLSILFLLVAIITSQNTITTELKFLLWSVQAPLIVMIVVIFILGFVIGLISSSNYERKKKKKDVEIHKKTEEKASTSDKTTIK